MRTKRMVLLGLVSAVLVAAGVAAAAVLPPAGHYPWVQPWNVHGALTGAAWVQPPASVTFGYVDTAKVRAGLAPPYHWVQLPAWLPHAPGSQAKAPMLPPIPGDPWAQPPA